MNTSNKITLPPKILGLSGTFASGKDTVAAWLNQNYGYYHVSTSDMVRQVAQVRYGDTNRPTLLKTANELREERGGGVLVELAFEQFGTMSDQYKGGLVISGVRSLGEAEKIREIGGYLLFIDAPQEDRYERSKKRARGDESSLSLDQFIERESLEINPTDSHNKLVQNLAGVEQMADATITNNHTLEQFLDDIAVLLELK